MKCSEFMIELTDMLDERLDADLRRELDSHMTGCSHCKVVYVTTKQTIQIYRDHELYDIEPDLLDRLQKAIMAGCKKHKCDKPE
jgi:anti-sigma factor RsiW